MLGPNPQKGLSSNQVTLIAAVIALIAAVIVAIINTNQTPSEFRALTAEMIRTQAIATSIQQATSDALSTDAARGTAYAVATQNSIDQTAIAVHGTETALPTPAPTDTLTLTPTVTPTTILPGPSVTKIPAWKPFYQSFYGYQMALVPAGCFMMGSNDGQSDEQPVNQQCFDQPFWIDLYEVTNEQYGSEGYFKGDTRPRDSVTWFEARDFCARRGSRLPTEREWEYAARGPSNYIYPWGNLFIADNVVFNRTSDLGTTKVGSKRGGRSWVGAFDLSGNVWEWVSSANGKYPYKSDDGRELNNDTASIQHGLRGGSWFNPDSVMGSANRDYGFPTFQVNTIGFRCARDY